MRQNVKNKFSDAGGFNNSGARNARSLAPLLYGIVVTHQAEKFGLETVRPTVQDATFGMRGQLHCGHYLNYYVMEGRREAVMRRPDCVCNLDTPSVCAETPADDSEERILEC